MNGKKQNEKINTIHNFALVTKAKEGAALGVWMLRFHMVCSYYYCYYGLSIPISEISILFSVSAESE